jgi:hypothetical protein
LFNIRNANSTGNYIKFIADSCTSTSFDIERSLTNALLIERGLPNLTKNLGYKWRNQINGVYLLRLVAQENVVENLGKILRWAVNQYISFEA